jgi:UDP-GlcNAc:undecaprenyl-phosphate GlcNAc-1-phosphate transferase
MEGLASSGIGGSMVLMGVETLLVSAIMTWVSTPLAIRFARWLGAIDRPGPRKIHTSPIPRLGGVPIFFGFLAGLTFAAYTTGYTQLVPVRLTYWTALAGAAFCMLILGVADDFLGLSFKSKFAVQLAAALTVWLWGFRIETITFPLGGAPLHMGWLSLPVTLLWIVGITNAINLIDGLDGLAAGCALITTTAVAVIALHGGRVAVTALSVALVGSLIGFLRFNFNPARIFLGDSGSMFLGFVLAVISIHGSQKGPTAVAVFAPLLILGFPILDTSLAIVRRLYRLGAEEARNDRRVTHVLRNIHHVFLPDRGHLHHRLLDLGLTQRAAVLSLYVIMISLALVALVNVVLNSVLVAGLLLAVLAMSVSGFVATLRWQKRRKTATAGVPGTDPGSARFAGTSNRNAHALPPR